MRTYIATAAAAVLTCSLALSGQQPPAAGAAPAAPQAGGGRGQQGPQVVSPEVNADRTVILRLLAPKATQVTSDGRAPERGATGADDQGRRWDLDHHDARRAAGYVHLCLRRRRREHAGSAQSVGQAGVGRRPGIASGAAGRRAAVLGLEAGAARPAADRHLRVEVARRDAPGLRLHATGLQPLEHEVPRAVSAARRRGSRPGLVDDGPRPHHPGQPDCGAESAADGRGDARGARRRQPGCRTGRHVARDQGRRQHHAWRPWACRRTGRRPARSASGARGARPVRAGLHRRSDAARREDVPRLDASGQSRHRGSLRRGRGDGQHRLQPAGAVQGTS